MWGKIGASQRITIIVVLVGVVAGLGALSFWARQPDYGLVFKNLAQDEVAEMVTVLTEEQIPYRLSSRGTSLLVPVYEVHKARLKLASRGLPKRRPGFEIFDGSNLGITDFVQHVNYVRALEGELARTISAMEEVHDARIHVVKPEPSFFVAEDKPATASVWVRLAPGARLSKSQTGGVARLVANSVEGLDVDNVSIVDQNGNPLNPQHAGDLAASTAQMEALRGVETRLTTKAQKLLDRVLGRGKSHVEVTAKLNFKKVTEQTTKHDPDGRVVIEEKISTEEEGPGTQRTGAGAPGVASNTGQAASNDTVVGGRRADSQEETRYAVDETVRTITEEVGDIEQLWVAVTVDFAERTTKDDKGKETVKVEPRTDDELTHLEGLVKQAVGFVENRDQFQISNMRFDQSGLAPPVAALDVQQRRHFLVTLVKHASVAVAVIAFLLFIRGSLKAHAAQPAQALAGAPAGALAEGGAMALAEGEAPEGAGQAAVLEHPPVPKEPNLRDIVVEHVQTDPKAAADLLRRWLSEEE